MATEQLHTETLDKLYLEWSQFTKARTQRELELAEALQFAVANGANWTLNDWSNWRTYHAATALGGHTTTTEKGAGCR